MAKCVLGGSNRDLLFWSIEDTCEADAGGTGLLRTKHNWLIPRHALCAEFKGGFGDKLEGAMCRPLQRCLSLHLCDAASLSLLAGYFILQIAFSNPLPNVHCHTCAHTSAQHDSTTHSHPHIGRTQRGRQSFEQMESERVRL